MLVELLQQLRDHRGARVANVLVLDEEVVAEVHRAHARAVDDRERTNPRQHQVLERLRACRAAVQQAHVARLHGGLAMLAPEAQLTVVTLLLRRLRALRRHGTERGERGQGTGWGEAARRGFGAINQPFFYYGPGPHWGKEVPDVPMKKMSPGLHVPTYMYKLAWPRKAFYLATSFSI